MTPCPSDADVHPGQRVHACGGTGCDDGGVTKRGSGFPFRATAVAGGLTAVTAATVSAAWVGVAVYLAKMLLTPDHDRPDNILIRDVSPEGERITLGATADTVVPGRYGLWFAGNSGHLRVGEVLERDEDAGTVVRAVDCVDWGVPAPGPGRWDSYYYATDPGDALGMHCADVHIPSEVGDLPAWHVPAGPPAVDEAGGRGKVTQPGDAPPGNPRWAILVHGRGATRHETVRGVPVLHEMGFDVLIPSYRNAPGAPASADGLYNLGLTEWRDVESSVAYAVEHGAAEVVLFGWSMGGAIVLQMLDQSPLAPLVTRVVLDSPVIDWADVITHQAALRRIPAPLTMLAQTLLGARWSRRLVGVLEPIDVARTSWQYRADELRHPMLLIHSVADDFVPVGPSRELARKRPDLIRYEEWSLARHVKEWNTDPGRWNRAVREFLTR